MTMMDTDPGTQLAADGTKLTLPSGHVVRVRYGFRALLALEQHFGGLANIQAAVSQNAEGAALQPLVHMLAAGLLREHDGTGAPLTYDRLADVLDETPPAQVQPFLTAAGEAVAAAMAEAFPPASKDAEGNDQGQTASPGPTGTTPPPSSSDAPTTPSG